MKNILFQLLIPPLNNIIKGFHFFIILLLSVSCTTKENSTTSQPINEINIVPNPAKLLYKRGFFKLDKNTRLLMNLSDQNSKKNGEYLLRELKAKTQLKIKIADRFSTSKINSSIEIITEQLEKPLQEGYKIEITSDKIRIYGSDEAGLVYGINTLISLFSKSEKSWQAPQLVIEDFPSTTFRGLIFSIDSLPYSVDRLVYNLQKSRINHLIIKSNRQINGDSNVVKTLTNKKYLTATSNQTSIASFYKNKPTTDSLLFNIININQLNKDSLAILGEAMWSKPQKLNYKNLVNTLNHRPKK